MITLPLQSKVPFKEPSILISLLALIIPSTIVPATKLLVEPDTEVETDELEEPFPFALLLFLNISNLLY
jgi:hypothetical protein